MTSRESQAQSAALRTIVHRALGCVQFEGRISGPASCSQLSAACKTDFPGARSASVPWRFSQLKEGRDRRTGHEIRGQTGASQMRRLILLLLAMAVVIPAGAARRVTVAQLEEALAAAILEHRPDADVARQVNAMELSERLTENTLNRFAGKLALQPRTALALQLLADQSAFLDPPAERASRYCPSRCRSATAHAGSGTGLCR